jgi:hypothetical protein
MTRDEYNKLFHKVGLNRVAFKAVNDCDDEILTLVNAAIAAEREWQGLTDEEMSEAYNVNYSIYKEHVEYVDFVLIYRAIEAKLKEKNT